MNAHVTVTLNKKNRLGTQYLIEYARNKRVLFALCINTGILGGMPIKLSFLRYESAIQIRGLTYADLDMVDATLPLNRGDKAVLQKVFTQYLSYLQGLSDNDTLPITEISDGQYFHSTTCVRDIRPTLNRLIQALQSELSFA